MPEYPLQRLRCVIVLVVSTLFILLFHPKSPTRESQAQKRTLEIIPSALEYDTTKQNTNNSEMLNQSTQGGEEVKSYLDKFISLLVRSEW